MLSLYLLVDYVTGLLLLLGSRPNSTKMTARDASTPNEMQKSPHKKEGHGKDHNRAKESHGKDKESAAAQFDKNITTDPDVLLIKPPYDQSQFLNLRITNAGSKLCMFKVLASHPKLYKIKNRVGILKPAETAISVIKLEPCTHEALAGNKIVVQTSAVHHEPANREDFWKFVDPDRDNIQFTRVKVTTKEEPVEEQQAKSSSIVGTPTAQLSPSDPPRIRTIPVKDIVFNGPFTQVDTTAFTVYNLTQHFLYFRFLFASDIFRIRPQFAIVDPSKNKIFAVIIKNLNADEEIKAANKKHRLRIEFMESDNNKEDAVSIWDKEGPRVHYQKMNIYVKP